LNSNQTITNNTSKPNTEVKSTPERRIPKTLSMFTLISLGKRSIR